MIKKNLSIAILDQGIVSLSNFITSIILTRSLGLEIFGSFYLSWVIILLAQNVQLAFILNPLLNIGPKLEKESKSEQNKYFNNSLSIQIGFSIVSVLTVILIFLFGEKLLELNYNNDIFFLISFCLALFATQLHEFCRRFFYVKRRSKNLLSIDLIRYLFQIVSLLIIGSLGFQKTSFVYLIITISAIFPLLIKLKDLPRISGYSINLKNTFKKNWKLAQWLIPSSIIYWISQNLFLFVSNKLIGVSAVGLIRVIQNLFAITNIGFQAFDNWGQVEAARVFNKKGIKGLNLFTKKLIFYLGLATSLIVILIAINYENLMLNIFNVIPDGYGFAILIYSFSRILSGLSSPFKYYVACIGKTNLNFASEISGFITVLILTYPLINNFGLSGALCCITLMQLSLFFTYIYNIKIRGLKI